MPCGAEQRGDGHCATRPVLGPGQNDPSLHPLTNDDGLVKM